MNHLRVINHLNESLSVQLNNQFVFWTWVYSFYWKSLRGQTTWHILWLADWSYFSQFVSSHSLVQIQRTLSKLPILCIPIAIHHWLTSSFFHFCPLPWPSNQATFLSVGDRIGFITRDTNGLIQDMQDYRPHYFSTVPRILMRVHAQVMQRLGRSKLLHLLYHQAVAQKLAEQAQYVAQVGCTFRVFFAVSPFAKFCRTFFPRGVFVTALRGVIVCSGTTRCWLFWISNILGIWCIEDGMLRAVFQRNLSFIVLTWDSELISYSARPMN